MALAVTETNFFPLSKPYHFFYSLAAKAVTRIIVRSYEKWIKSLYVCRSAADGPLVPGLSDIDLCCVINDETPHHIEVDLNSFFNRLGAEFPLIGAHQIVFRESEILRLNREEPFFQYRFEEAKRTWRVLHGKNFLPSLEPPTTPIDGRWTELKIQWTLFVGKFLGVSNQQTRFDERAKEYLLFKVILAFVRELIAESFGEEIFGRRRLLGVWVERSTEIAALPQMRAHQAIHGYLEFCYKTRFRRSFAQCEPKKWTSLKDDILRFLLK